MNRMPWIASLAIIAACGVAADVARAGPLDRALVGGKARFVVHVDVDAARKTAVGKKLLESLGDNDEYVEFERMMTDAAGFMPANDIEDFTLWGEVLRDQPPAVIVLHARMDAARLRAALANAADFRIEKYGDKDLLSWRDEKKGGRVHAYFADGRTVLISGDGAAVRRGIDVMANRDESLAAQPAEAMPAAASAEAWAFAAVVGVNTAPNAAGNPVLSQVASGSFELVQRPAEQTEARAAIIALDPAKGPQLLRFATGMQAMAQMGGPGETNAKGKPIDPKRAALLELLDATTIAGSGGTVTATATLPDERAETIAQALVQPKE